MEQIGYMYCGNEDHEYNILRNKEGNLFTYNISTNKIESALLEELSYYLCAPWDTVQYYEENSKHHWYSIVYDWIEIDVWGNSLEDMMNNVAHIFKQYMDGTDKKS